MSERSYYTLNTAAHERELYAPIKWAAIASAIVLTGCAYKTYSGNVYECPDTLLKDVQTALERCK